MHRIRKKIEQLKYGTSPKITQDKLEEYGLVGRVLRSYQLDGVGFISKCYDTGHGCILGDEMGLGKTIQVISLLINLKGSKKIDGPFLILCPLSVLDNWKSELKRFASPLKVLTLVGDKDEREALKNSVQPSMGQSDFFNVLPTTYEICIREVSFLSNFHWKVLAVDEAHRLKNSKSLLHQELSMFNKDFSILLTGTPVQNNLNELYSLLSFVAPKIFKEDFQEEFVDKFSDINSSSGKCADLQYLLSPFLLRRVKSEVMKDLPQKTEVILYTGMTDLQKKYYKGILTKDIGVFSNEGPNRTGLKNVLVRLRQCVNHPYLFDGVEPEPFVLGDHLITASGKLCVLDKLLSFLHKRDHKVLMFSQMTRMLDILQDYLGYRGFTYERLDGSVRGEERYLAIRTFNEMDDTFAFLLSTRAGGQGLNLTSADTVIFVDSDYNPQNDLQAAARAHRLGQTRPVKIIRLVARNTVEEIILRRADDKLRLTNNVIEGGQFSSIAQGLNQIAETNLQLGDILKFGLDKLFDSDENVITDEDFERILGKSSNGKWVVVESTATKDIAEEKSSETEGTNMYVYEGHDYSKETSDRDKDAFDKMVKDMLEEVTSSERATRSVSKILQPSILDLPTRKRKVLTAEELEERRKKREENAAKREEAKRKRLELLRKENNYNSLNITLSEDDEEGSEEELTDEEEERHGIQYVKGDVTQPINNTGNPAIIVHCVDDSGHWGKGGLFTAISRRSSSAVQSYELAGAMEDLHTGDAHLIPFDEDQQQRQQNYLSLIVAQTRDKHHRLLPMNLSALSEGLERVHKAAKQLSATVHLPRIGHTTPGFNWYGTERLIRKHLASRGIPTSIYYYPRKQETVKKRPDLSSSGSDASDDNEGTSAMPRRKPKKPRVASDLSDNSSDESEGFPKGSRRYGKQPRAMSELSDNSSDENERSSASRKLSKQHRLFSESSSSSLPDFFSGVRIYFKDVPEENMKTFGRYVIAYNGDVESLLCDDVTHIVCDVKDPQLKGLDKDAIIVTTRWLEDCIKKQRLLDTTKYSLK